jgi:hypothetical protein
MSILWYKECDGLKGTLVYRAKLSRKRTFLMTNLFWKKNEDDQFTIYISKKFVFLFNYSIVKLLQKKFTKYKQQ